MLRKSLFTAAAVAPLVLLAGAPASAETTISDARTSTVRTSTASNGNPDDVTIASGGSVTVTSGEAVVLDSNNRVTNSGTIRSENANNTTGVLIQGGRTGAFVNSSAIRLDETYEPKDTTNDGIPDGVFAEGSGRYGVRLTGSSPFVGDITTNAGSSVVVEGNSSAGISLEAQVQGAFVNGGTVAITGNDTAAIRQSGGVTGMMRVTGPITAQGGNAVGIDVSGDVGGPLGVYSTMQVTGYRTGQRSANPAANEALLPENLLQSGSAIDIRANIGGGLFIGAPPAGTSGTDTTTDADGDGIVDSTELSARVTVLGSAPAISVGAAGRTVGLGAFGSGDNAYGIIVRGQVTGDGVFDDRSATGIRLGTGDGTVNIAGGVRVVGSVAARAYEDDAQGIHVRAGATAPQIRNEGAISAEVISAEASRATAIEIEAGGSVTSLLNAGVVAAKVTGDLGDARAVVDHSGTLSTVVNSNQITASLAAASSEDTPTGDTTALDLRNNATGVSLTQTANSSTEIKPLIAGDIFLGSGSDTVSIQAGSVLGALDFAGGGGSMSVSGGATYAGRMTASGVLSSVSVSDGRLENQSPTTIRTGSLSVGDKGVLVISADPANNRATHYEVSGAASIANGGKLGLHLTSLPTGAQTYTIISAGSLSVGTPASDLSGQAPYLFVAGFTPNVSAGAIDLNLRRRTAAEAGLNTAQTAAYDQIYAGLSRDEGIQRAFLAQTDQAGLTGMLDQMLPDYAGGVFRALSWAAEQHGVATGEAPLGQENVGPTRAWTNEIVLSEDKEVDQAAGYRALAISAVGGVESVSARGDALGVRVGFTAANVRNSDLAGDNLMGVSQLSAAVYWRGSFGALRADAQLGGGFFWADGRREFLYSDATSVVHRVAESKWNGYSLYGRLGAAYRAEFGRGFLEPRVHVDYFRLAEGGHTEEGGGSGFDLAVDSRTSQMLSVTGSVAAGATFGSGFRWRPQVEVGYRAVVSGSAGDTTAALDSGGPSFTLPAEQLQDSALFGRVGVRIYSTYLDLMLSAGAEVADLYTDLDVSLTARTVF